MYIVPIITAMRSAGVAGENYREWRQKKVRQAGLDCERGAPSRVLAGVAGETK
jgi:hypothetical protein